MAAIGHLHLLACQRTGLHCCYSFNDSLERTQILTSLSNSVRSASAKFLATPVLNSFCFRRDGSLRTSATCVPVEVARKQPARDQPIYSEPFELHSWRQQPIRRDWYWGQKGPEKGNARKPAVGPPESFAACALKVLTTPDPLQKIALTHSYWEELVTNDPPIGSAIAPFEPSRPALPKRVPSKEVPGPKDAGVPLNAYLLLTLAHIELNAIDLAWDTVCRFSALGFPKAFYMDFARVADDESRHLGWCLQRLAEMGVSYGDIPAHSMLWEGAQKSADDLVARLVLVPCSQEARGLDAGPRLVQRLMSNSDHRSAAIVQKIADEELAHVAVGCHWFRTLCGAMGVEEGTTFRTWLAHLSPDLDARNFDHKARLAAGLQRQWYDLKAFPPTAEEMQWPVNRLQSVDPGEMVGVLERLGHMLQIETKQGSCA